MKLESVKRTTLTGCYILENLKVITLLTAAWFIPFAAAIPQEKEVTESTFTSEEEVAESAFTSEERYSVAADNYGVLSHDLLGEQHDAYTGEVGFAQTDLIIPTNSDLKLKIKRIKGVQSSSSYKIFGDWSLDLPRLYGPIRANFHSGVDRCTTIGWNATKTLRPGIEPEDNQNGPLLAGLSTSMQLYGKNVTYSLPANAYFLNKENWVISCSNGIYSAKSPDGTTYTFGQIAYSRFDNIYQGISATKPAGRSMVTLLLSKEQDVHGNSISYTYSDAKLTKIQSNETNGASILLTYNADGMVSKITSNGRSWLYSYTDGDLTKVTLPDSRYWKFALAALIPERPPSKYDQVIETGTGTIQHPNGTIGTFNVRETLHARSNVPKERNMSTGRYFLDIDSSHMSLVRKSISGPGLPSMIWTYNYSENGGGRVGENVSDSKYIKITNPEGVATKITYSRRFGWREGLILSEEVYDGGLVSKTENTWTKGGVIGKSINGMTYLLEGYTHKTQKTKSVYSEYRVGGTDTYTTNYSNFTKYGSPKTVTETGNVGSRTQTLSYYSNSSKWLLDILANRTIGNDLSITRTHNANGQLISETKNGVSKTFGYTGALLTSVKDARGYTTTYSNYYRGIPRAITYPIGSMKATVNYFGKLSSFTNQNGDSFRYTYDTNNRVTFINLPTGDDISYTYGTNSVTKIQGNYKQVDKLDGLNRSYLTSYQDTHLNITRYQNRAFNSDNKLKFESIMSLQSTEPRRVSLEYDAIGRLTTLTSPISSSIYKYLSNNITKITDGRGASTTNHYAGYGSADDGYVYQINTPSSSGTIITSFSKNSVGKLLSVTQGGYSILYGYHPTYKDYITSEVYPAFGHYYGRDALGNITSSRTDGSGTTYYTYDALNRRTLANYPGSTKDISYSYKPTGELLRAVNGVGDVSYRYDKLGRVIARSTLVDGTDYDFTYAYSGNGGLSNITYPDNSVVYYAPNAFKEPTKASNYVTDVLYEPTGALKSFSYGNGLKYVLNTDSSKMRVASIWGKNGSNFLIKKSYSYDAQSNITSITDGINSSHSISNILYDNAERILSAYSSAWGGSRKFGYDKTGNITSKTVNGITNIYNYDTNNQLSSISGTYYNFSYDVYGNVTTNGKHSFDFNDAGQMLSSSYGNDSSSYEYDALGRRVKVTTNGVTSIEINGDNESLLWLLEGDGLPVKKVYLGTKLVASEKNSVARYMHFDILGSVIGTSDARRAFSSEEYTPFGEKVKNTTDPQNDQWFTGKRFDTKTGLSYMQARYYDPVIGRFYSNDPVDSMGHMARGNPVHGFNRYAYANNNPYKYTDPDGEFPIMQVIGGIIGGIQAAQAVSGSNAHWTDKAIAVAAGVGIGALTGGRGGAAVKAITSKVTSKVAKTAVGVTTGGAVGGVSSATSQVVADVVTGQEVTAEKTGQATVNGVISGAVGGAPAKTAEAVATTILTETVLQAGQALANDTPPPPPPKQEKQEKQLRVSRENF
ncbi:MULTISPECIES: RHS repeat domain-containing protein [unclassified Pseudoalteromonas]|uniref:RHS repeat domain-containing protein n=2 Tax=Pseudoalteromonas TaxID=53246 RepID=UPI001F2DEB41|nr:MULTISPECIES: RHS repeat-associated core domain-containing protein [unclassified Pseudoalteromonas]MCF2827305.1 hypothetical protein [Pseudoalteromonas sp. OF5H-5]MCF2926463.1 hypothetical protein [Pseudoalteromonas sp. DL2-H1]